MPTLRPWTRPFVVALCLCPLLLGALPAGAQDVPGLGAVGKATPATEKPFLPDSNAPADLAGTRCGDWGHFLSYTPRFYLNNPDGEPFTVTVHQMQWGIRRWTKDQTGPLRLTGPGGEVLVEGRQKLDANSSWTFSVDKAAGGVYELACSGNLWVSSSLKQSVAWTGEPGVHIRDYKGRPERKFYEKRGALVFQASVPRRWWFYVPKGVTTFTCRAMRADTCMSQREDWGFFITSPRGQRVRALWGQPPIDAKPYHQVMSTEVEVDPGAGGRFWSLSVRLGDSHNYSNINFSLDGVPPYLARSPEEWFDPNTGKGPQIDPYDETPFMQSARIEDMLKALWPNLQHFSPCPSLGDPDGVEVIGDATFALWNPQGRKLKFRIGTYLPRVPGMKSHVRIVGPDGKNVVDEDMPMGHIHGKHGGPTHTLDTGKGVSFVQVTQAERFLAYTYPATPLVLIGQATTDGWAQFNFTAGTARNWYFFVPAGTKQFKVRAASRYASDVMNLQVCAPDKVVEILHARKGQATIDVPPGMDGKVWHLRPDVGMATRMVTAGGGPDYRYLDMYLSVDIQGVPGYLSPTWEQWFDPQDPKPAEDRAK